VRINVTTGERTVIAQDPALFNFPVSMKFLRRCAGMLVAVRIKSTGLRR
jgi:ethanolamine utilization microcompartment shell protein EutS